MAKKPSPKPPSAPSTSKVIAQIAKTRADISAAALARATPAPRGATLKKEGNLVKPPG